MKSERDQPTPSSVSLREPPSPPRGEGASASKLILVAQVGGAFGVKGEVRITAYTADPMALVTYSPLLRADGAHGLTIVSARPDKAGVVARVKEVATKEEADALRGLKLHIPRDRLPPPDDEDDFYLTDLVGLEARDATEAVIGRVKSVQNFGASDMLEIAPATGGATWYLPFTREAVPEVRIADGWLRALRPAEIGEPEPSGG